MERMLSRFSWMPSTDGTLGSHLEPDDIPLPKRNPDLIDTTFIHWGYTNVCFSVVEGKELKEETWQTYWSELCGATLTLYNDVSLNKDSAQSAPPTTLILPQNERKSDTLGLADSGVRILDDNEYSDTRRERTCPYVSGPVCRRHLFEVKFNSTGSTYVFQAPSRSSLLWWVMKLQESIDAIENDSMPPLTEERLALVREMRVMTSLGICDHSYDDVDGVLEEEEEEEEDADADGVTGETENKVNPELLNLRKQLVLKTEQVLQFEAQILDFYGRGKGDFKRDEFVCTTKQDYFLVPGRVETFIPSGTKVDVLGKLPNHRWRCFVERKELVKVIENIVNDLKCENKEEDGDDVNGQRSRCMTKEELNNLLNNLPDYPLLGCLPNSILCHEPKTITNNITAQLTPKPRRSPNRTRTTKYNITIIPSPPPDRHVENCNNKSDLSNDNNKSLNHSNSHSIEAPLLLDLARSLENSSESSGRSSASDINIGDINIDIDINLSDLSIPSPEANQIDVPGLKFTDLDSYETPPISDSEETTKDEENEKEQDSLKAATEEDGNDLVEGFVIHNRLRQKGIGIIVGDDSSSEEEDDEGLQMKERMQNRLQCNGVANAVFQKYMSMNKAKRTVAELDRSWDASSSDNYLNCSQDTLSSVESIANTSGGFSTNQELLHQFGQQSIHLEQDKALAKALVQVFHESKKGPDVKPPRNERRTLKLSKSQDQGYGFWLQTYNVGSIQVGEINKQMDTGKMNTFVRYVEDEGPAYLAGLRAGDVIVGVGEMDVEDMEHMKIVGLISETRSELILVVKFLDMVRQVDLTIRLNNRRIKLKLKEEELKKIEEEEKRMLELFDNIGEASEAGEDELSVLSTLPPSSTSSAYSLSFDGEVDLVNLDTSTDSLGSQSSISEDVTVTTSKFEKYSPRVLDSIKEINCVCNNIPEPNTALSTTDKDLLSLHSDKDLLMQHSEQMRMPWSHRVVSIKHHENLFDPDKRNSLPLSLDAFKSRSPKSERNSYIGSDRSSEVEASPDLKSGLRSNHVPSPKLRYGLQNSNVPSPVLEPGHSEDEVFTEDLDDGLGPRTESYKRAQENILSSPPESQS